MDKKITYSTGNIKISDEVITTIVKSVLHEMEGVHSLALKPLSASEMLLKTSPLKPINIRLNVDVAEIDLVVNLCFGYKLREVAEQIQNRIKDTVQDMTGIAVNKVNIYVAGVKTKESK